MSTPWWGEIHFMSGLQSPAGEKYWVSVAPYQYHPVQDHFMSWQSERKAEYLHKTVSSPLKTMPLLCSRTHVLRKAGQYSVAPSVFPPSPSPALNQAAPWVLAVACLHVSGQMGRNFAKWSQWGGKSRTEEVRPQRKCVPWTDELLAQEQFPSRVDGDPCLPEWKCTLMLTVACLSV